MRNDYLCPHCRGHLKVHEHIVFLARKGNDDQGLVFLSPELGDYRPVSHPTFKLEEGKHYDFFCPMCQADLAAGEISENLARIIKVDDDGVESYVLFSEIAGEKCTYVIHNDDIEAYGEDQARYMNFFGESPKY
jgi:hypothetical protein